MSYLDPLRNRQIVHGFPYFGYLYKYFLKGIYGKKMGLRDKLKHYDIILDDGSTILLILTVYFWNRCLHH